jgi:hypothetical protein
MDFKQATKKYPGYKSILDFIKWKQLPKDSDLTAYEYLVRVWKQRPLAPGSKPSQADLEKYSKLYWDEKILDRESVEVQKDWVDYVNGKRDKSKPYHNYVGDKPKDGIEESFDEIDKLNKELDSKLSTMTEQDDEEDDFTTSTAATASVRPPSNIYRSSFRGEAYDDDDAEHLGGVAEYFDAFKKDHPEALKTALSYAKKAAQLHPVGKASTDLLQRALLKTKWAPTIPSIGAHGVLEQAYSVPAIAKGDFTLWPKSVREYTWFVYNCNKNSRAKQQFEAKWNEADRVTRLATLQHLQDEFPASHGKKYFNFSKQDAHEVESFLQNVIDVLVVKK